MSLTSEDLFKTLSEAMAKAKENGKKAAPKETEEPHKNDLKYEISKHLDNLAITAMIDVLTTTVGNLHRLRKGFILLDNDQKADEVWELKGQLESITEQWLEELTGITAEEAKARFKAGRL